MKHLKKREKRRLGAVHRSDWLESVTRGSMAYDWQARNETVFDGLIHPDQWRQWLQKGPCPGCPCEGWCDRICAMRAKWWDDHMARLRRQMGMK